MNEEKRIVLFWDKEPFPNQIELIKKSFELEWSDYKVELYSDRTASEFIERRFGKEEKDIYLNCRIPAMRSDLFRLFSIYDAGGIWVDLKFFPRTTPPDEIISKLYDFDMICCRWPHGRIVNGIFAARKNSYIGKSMLEEALKNIKERKSKNIFLITGPGMWKEVLDKFVEDDDFFVIHHDEIFRKFLMKKEFLLSGRGGRSHWSERQKEESLFYDEN